MATRRSGRHPYHHGDLRRALLREADAVLRAEGAGALSLREVARRAGVSPAAPYAHFPDKEALLAALAAEGFRRLTRDLRAAFKGAAHDPLRRLKAMTAEYVRFAVTHPAYLRLMFGAERPAIERYPDLHEVAHEAAGVILTAIVDCQQAGQIEAGDPMERALFVWVVIHGLAELLLSGMMPLAPGRAPAQVEGARLAEAFVRRAMVGLAPRRR